MAFEFVITFILLHLFVSLLSVSVRVGGERGGVGRVGKGGRGGLWRVFGDACLYVRKGRGKEEGLDGRVSFLSGV